MIDAAHSGGAPGRGGTGLQARGLSKRFGGLQVFEEVSFDLSPGELLGVIGPNGAGKTTLVNVLCGRIGPTAGRVLLGGKDVTNLPMHERSRRGLVRSFQQTNTFKTASVRENLSRALLLGGRSRGDRHLEPFLQRWGLASRFDQPSDKLPYGLQKVLGLLMAYATSPAVLLLDEPAAGLDRSGRTRVDELVEHARTTLGCAVLIIEHDMDLIRRLCPRIIVLEAGRMLAQGPPAEVLARTDVIEAYLGIGHDEE